MTVGERIKKVRKALDLTQQEFADRIGSKRNTVATYEMGRSAPSAAVLSLISREFNVSEEWLRTGAGAMFLQVSREDELSAAVNKLLSGESSDFKTRLIKILADLGPREWDILESYALKLVQDKPASEESVEQEARAEAERYYKQLISEKRQASQASSAKESDVG